MKRAATLVRVFALIVSLVILAMFWIYVTSFTWGIYSGAFLGFRSASGPSLIFIVCAVLSYIYVAALLFGASLRQK